MTTRDQYQRLLKRYAECSDLSFAASLLSWDQETMMPPKGLAARAEQLATLAGIRHDLFTANEVCGWLADCEARLVEFDEVERAQLRELRRELDRVARVPRDLVEELARTQTEALDAWRFAREKNDFPRFEPYFVRLVHLCSRKADAIGFEEERIDALLDEYERGATARSIASLFEGLKSELSILLGEVRARPPVDDSCVLAEFDEKGQAELGLKVIRALGFDMEAGRVDVSSHPFCSTMGDGDIRLTRRFHKNDLRTALFGIIHEAGHGMYEQGIPSSLRRTPLGDAASLGIHESQSRLWENIIGRSEPFAEYLLPLLRSAFPGCFATCTPRDLYRAFNRVEASFIRVEADELTYSLHVCLRFEVERALFAGDLEARDVPAVWNEKMRQSLGIVPPNDADGCLQDIHWSMGAFGYFPTYTLGNLYAAQLFEAAGRDIAGLEASIRAGRFETLRTWLREKVHRKARLLEPHALIEEATSRKPSPDAFLGHLRKRFTDVYGVS